MLTSASFAVIPPPPRASTCFAPVSFRAMRPKRKYAYATWEHSEHIFPFVGPWTNCPKLLEMGPRVLFPTNLDLANILGDMDLDLENFYFCKVVGFQVSRFPGFQISRSPDFHWAKLGLGQASMGQAGPGPGLGPGPIPGRAVGRVGPWVGPHLFPGCDRGGSS